ncbi:NAD(P)H-dependent oxidoreductase [Paraburkholderia sabiae]|uniref:NAD(P)H-dependent oxidoreductase n=1 Tax=Paraburkholderia sabiae TaxID=273251 RepID=A0ABU9Q652_9BURK|nr:NAD(P)H-dependent oxidoreductase [Paraburkholderia sabiae]WJZ78128.1 NAD(P)H-dependent oxidoreductase [Paraburkholderia sabiae]CAD6528999.1 Glutathione-regulated potassium-efflux system ancillary protein KefF [Paraburkholderia sabiae]
MRKVHIVHAHPEPRSFCTAMAHEARRLLALRGDDVSFSDLYALDFDPVVRASDFVERADRDYLVYALEQRHALEHNAVAPDIQREVDALMSSDILMLVFPLYWFSVPALIKGWIDRCFLSGALYGGKRIYGRGGMAGKRAVIGVTLGGREHMFGAHAIHGELAGGMLRHLLQGTLGYVGYEVLDPFFAWHVPYCSPSERADTLAHWRDFVETLDAQPSLTMPGLEDYDDVFRPRTQVASR